MLVGDNLQQLIDDSGLTLGQFAAKCGISPSTVRDMLMGETKKPKRTTIRRISDTFNVSPESIMGDSTYFMEHLPTNPRKWAKVYHGRPTQRHEIRTSGHYDGNGRLIQTHDSEELRERFAGLIGAAK